MKTTLGERDGNTVQVAVEVTSEELQEAFDTRLRQLSREVRIPGFRPGKAPTAMVRQRLGDEYVLADTVEESMGGWYAQAMVELGLEPVDRPEIEVDDEEDLELGKSLSFKATVTVMPELVLGEYKGLKVPKQPSEVEDQEVDAQMERLRNEFAELRPVTGRAAQMGDFVTADFHATLDGEPVEDLEASDYLFDLGGSRMFPGVEEQMVDMNAGDEKTFPFEAPEGFPNDLGGKTVDFTVKLKEIKEKILPEVSDQWVSEVSEFATLLELRQEIRGKLQAGKTYAADQQFRAMAVKVATDNATVDLPEVVVQSEAQELLEDFKNSIESQGGTLEGYAEAADTSVEKMLEDIAPQAANNVKTRMMLDAVAAEEGLDASDEEISAVVAQMAAGGKMDAKDLEKRLRKSGRLEGLRGQMVRDKAIDFIVQNAVATAPEPEPKPGTAEKATAAKKAAKAPADDEAATKPAAKKAPAKKAPAKKTAEDAAAKAATKSTAAESAAKPAAKKPAAKKPAAKKPAAKKPAASAKTKPVDGGADKGE